MGALPKRRHSSQRQGKRRAALKTFLPHVSFCSSCGKPVIPHQVCPGCGTYSGEKFFSPKVKKKKE